VKLSDEPVAAPLLDSVDAAALLGIPVSTLRRYATLGYVPSLKFSRSKNAHRFFEPATIEALRAGGLDALEPARRPRNGNGAST
jgi:hypothetical protein